MIDRCIVRNLVNPRRELELWPVARKRCINLDENFLRQVQRRIVITHHAVDVCRNWALVTTHQLFETILTPGQRTLHKFAVGQRVCQCDRVCHLQLLRVYVWRKAKVSKTEAKNQKSEVRSQKSESCF